MSNSLRPGTLRITKWRIEFATDDQIYSWEFQDEDDFKKRAEPMLADLQAKFGPLIEDKTQ